MELRTHIIVLKNGPIMIESPDKKLNLVNESTGLVYKEEKYFLCRCGASCKKPFCDSTHKKINFEG